MEAKARWTPVGTYASLAAYLLATTLGAAALMHVGEHETIPWSTLPMAAQRVAIAAQGFGVLAALTLGVGLLVGAGLLGAREDLSTTARMTFAGGAAGAVSVHAALAIAHVSTTPWELPHLPLLIVGAGAAVLALTLAGAGLMPQAARPRSRGLRRGLVVALALVAAGHILLAVSHSAMHGTF